MRNLSKSKLLAWRQCPKRLWLEIHRPKLREDSAATQAGFAAGHQVGAIAQRLYDPKGKGTLINAQTEGYDAALVRSRALLASSAAPIFEAGCRAEGALAFADVMLPVTRQGKRVWRMVEVKSSTGIKDYHHDDAAIQSLVFRSTGVPLESIALAYIDNQWVYPGNGDYNGLLIEQDLTDEAFSRGEEVKAWITDAQTIAQGKTAPKISTGAQCNDPYECGFWNHCRAQEPQAEHPVGWLPNVRRKSLKEFIANAPCSDLADVPDELLNEQQLRVKTVTLSGNPYFDVRGAAASLREHGLPAYFLDFETIQFAVPIWKGTRPYQQIPFQFSTHRLDHDGKLAQQAFLDLSGNNPSLAFIQALIAACGERDPVFVYNAGFETARIKELAERFPQHRNALSAINERIVDLLPTARDHYYHPSQQGSWSIKAVLPALCPDLNYADLDGVQDGGMAMTAYLEAIDKETSTGRKAEIEKQLLKYCALDTYAMVRLWSAFSGQASV